MQNNEPVVEETKAQETEVTQTNEKKKKRSLKELMEQFIQTIKEVGTYFTKKPFKDILLLVGEILVIIILLCLLKIPFSLIRDVFINVLFSMEVQSKLIMNLLYVIFGLPYYIMAILLFMKLFVDRYHDINSK